MKKLGQIFFWAIFLYKIFDFFAFFFCLKYLGASLTNQNVFSPILNIYFLHVCIELSRNLKKYKVYFLIILDGNTSFKCDICNETLSSKSLLNQHRKLHIKKTPFSCNICHKRFSKAERVLIHKRIHTGTILFY